MKIKIFAALVLSAFLLSAVGAVFAQKKTAIQTNQLTAQLPASDGVMTLDVQRLLNEGMPQMLSGNPQMIADINAKIDQLREKTGLDARQFEQLAVGVTIKPVSASEVDLEPVFLARGKTNANALISIAKLAAKGKYREEKIGARTIYVFSGAELIEQNKPKTTNNSWLDKAFEKMLNSLNKEVAVTSLDANTLAFGSTARVRETLETKTRIAAANLNLVNRKPNAMMSFGAVLPNGLSGFVNLDNDELGKALDSIRQISGAVEVSDGSAGISLVAKTLQAAQAQSLKELLDGLQMLGKTLIGAGKGEDKKVYARMIDNARITQSGNEILFDLQVPQSDINILVTGLK